MSLQSELAALTVRVGELEESSSDKTAEIIRLKAELAACLADPDPGPVPDPEPVPTPTFGASNYGPNYAPRFTDGDGEVRSSVSGLPTSGRVLLRAGTYGNFTIPPGVSVATYNREVVRTGAVNFGNESHLIGIYGNGGSNWFAHPNSTTTRLKAYIEFCELTGSGYEVVRASRNVELDIISTLIIGGANHCVKYHGEGSTYKPGGRLINSVFKDARGEDGFQAEGAGTILLDQCTFDGAAENNVDLKTGTITLDHCDFLRSTQGQFICHGNAVATLRRSRFPRGGAIELGSSNTGNATLTVEDVTLDGGRIWLKKSAAATLRRVTMLGGSIDHGQTDRGWPTLTTIDAGKYQNVALRRVAPASTLRLVNSPEIIGGSGW